MRLLHADTDIAVIALWLGNPHRAYIPARRHGAEGTSHRQGHPPGTAPGRYRPPDPLLAFVDGL
jgi:hypothetical protein